MSAFGDGFLAYHFDVYVETESFEHVKEIIKTRQVEFRDTKTWAGFPGSAVEWLESLPGVSRVEEEGPQSSVLIPLRMFYGMTGEQCTMSSVIGTGSVSTAIEQACEGWGILLKPSKNLTDVDSPVEFSLRDTMGRQESVRLYPAPRARFRAAVSHQETVPDRLILNRINQGLFKLAKRTFNDNKTVSLRIREFGRYDKPEDYVPVLEYTRHLVLSSRHGAIRKIGRYANICPIRLWPRNTSDLTSDLTQRLVRWLIQRMANDGVVVLHLYDANTTGFYREDYAPVIVAPPPGTGSASRAARIQGAMLGSETLVKDLISDVKGELAWRQQCISVVKEAFRGTERHPWNYPNTRKLQTRETA